MALRGSGIISRAFSSGKKSNSALISAQTLVEKIMTRDSSTRPVKVVDGSWFMPNEGKSAIKNFHHARIPGAVFFDIDDIADKTTTLPHMFPSPHLFAEKVGCMGINQDDEVVVYDQKGLFSAARVWHTLRVFGVHSVSVLDGGFPNWHYIGLPTDSGEQNTPIEPATFTPTLHKSMYKTLEEMLSNANSAVQGSPHVVVVDARSKGRWSGEDPEPRPGLPSGHIPHSLNLPFTEVLRTDPLTGAQHLKDNSQLQQAFDSCGLSVSSLDTPIITTCGSGVTASVLALALHQLGHTNVAVYDGSWTEWASTADAPIHTTRTV